MGPQVHQEKIEGGSGVELFGQVQHVGFAGAEPVQEDQRAGRTGVRDPPALDPDTVASGELRGFVGQAEISRSERRAVPDVPDDPGRTGSPPEEQAQPEEEGYIFCLRSPNQRE